MRKKNVLIIGGGVAGLTVALELARFDIHVDMVERSEFIGGHGIQLACKAVDQCVKCGACLVEEKLGNTVVHPNIRLISGSQVESIEKTVNYHAHIVRKPAYIDPDKCKSCGICFERCPKPAALVQGFSKSHTPFYAIKRNACIPTNGSPCTRCMDACPEGAINLNIEKTTFKTTADAVVLATGFKPFNPEGKPYGYHRFNNVITHLELERQLRKAGVVVRPSDGLPPNRLAFIQCVGSRDAKLNHLWCSKVCCGSALRMARVIKNRQTETDITCFYIDIQTFGKNFESFYTSVQKEIKMIRAIPGDIFKTEREGLTVTFVDNKTHQLMEEIFDLVVLSIGLTPCRSTKLIGEKLGIEPDDSGFVTLPVPGDGSRPFPEGIFAAGTVQGPMSIPETIADGGNTAREIISFLNRNGGNHT